jgi:hypothetical protein
MTQGQGGVTSEEAAWRDWTRTIEPVGTMMNKLFYNPGYSGQLFPFAEQFPLPENAQRTQWAPTQSTQRLYENYLNRQYGLPSRVAGAMSAKAMAPVRYQKRLGENPYNQAGARQAYNVDPQAMAQAQISRKEPEAMRQLDYLKGAGELAQFNLWRAQQVPRLIG